MWGFVRVRTQACERYISLTVAQHAPGMCGFSASWLSFFFAQVSQFFWHLPLLERSVRESCFGSSNCDCESLTETPTVQFGSFEKLQRLAKTNSNRHWCFVWPCVSFSSVDTGTLPHRGLWRCEEGHYLFMSNWKLCDLINIFAVHADRRHTKFCPMTCSRRVLKRKSAILWCFLLSVWTIPSVAARFLFSVLLCPVWTEQNPFLQMHNCWQNVSSSQRLCNNHKSLCSTRASTSLQVLSPECHQLQKREKTQVFTPPQSANPGLPPCPVSMRL